MDSTIMATHSKREVSLVHPLMNVTVAAVALIANGWSLAASLGPLENEEGDAPTESFTPTKRIREKSTFSSGSSFIPLCQRAACE